MSDTTEERIVAIGALIAEFGDLNYECGEWDDDTDVVDEIGNLAGYAHLSDKTEAKRKEAISAIRSLIETLRKDAARYAKLKVQYLGADFDYPTREDRNTIDTGERTCAVVVFDLPEGAMVSADLNATVDAWPASDEPESATPEKAQLENPERP